VSGELSLRVGTKALVSPYVWPARVYFSWGRKHRMQVNLG